MRAQEYFDRITFGRENAVKRPGNASIDRELRELVEKANNKDDCIINVGSGYYRPRPGDIVEEKEYHEYKNKDRSRCSKLQKKGLSMELTFRRWKENDLYNCYSRKA